MKLLRFIPLVILLGYLAIKFSLFANTLKDDDPIYEPTKDQQEQLEDLVSILNKHPKAAEQFKHMFNGFSLVVDSDNVILKTTNDVRLAHENVGVLAVQVGEIKQVPGFVEEVNDFLNEEIGNENVPLTKDKKDQVVDAFKALGWASSQ